jgi:hypothetical protein
MEKTQFAKLLASIEARYITCGFYLDTIQSTEDLKRLTIKEAAETRAFCLAEEEIMTKFLMVDLYHIIGMANLSPPQMMQFIYAVKEYSSYRSRVKALAKLESLSDLPNVSTSAKFKLLTMDFTVGDLNVAESEIAEVSDYKPEVGLPFSLDHRRIQLKVDQLDYFGGLLSNILKTPINLDNLRRSVLNHKEYCGIHWLSSNSEVAIGTFKTDSHYEKLKAWLNNHQ